MDIVTDPNPILHEKMKKVKNFDEKLKKLAHKMAEEVLDNPGVVGLAAPQVGESIKMSVIEFSPKRQLSKEEFKKSNDKAIPLTYLINPKITWHSSEQNIDDEGCLSLPDIELPINRYSQIHVLSQDLNGKKVKTKAAGYFARILQHEIDHLEGVLITDYSKTKISRVVFIGTPEFAVPILQRLIKSPYKPYLVITETDKPAGRSRKLAPPPVKILAEQNNIEIWQPAKISEVKTQLAELNPDLIIVAAYGQIIPKEILDSAKYGVLNVHPSLLPKYRGATPIQTALANGEKITGVTIMKMDEKMDHGPILTQLEVELNTPVTSQILSEILSTNGANLLVRTIPLYLMKEIKPVAQNHEKATFTKLLKKEDGKIDWNKTPKEIDNIVRAYNPWPGTFTIIDGKRLKICQTHLKNDKLIIDKVQLEGKKEIGFAEFEKGWHNNIDFMDKIR